MVYQLVVGKTLVELETHQSEYIENADGDYKRAEIVDLSEDVGRVIRNTQFNAGRPIKPDHLPTNLKRVSPASQPLSDYYSAPKGAAYVSERFKALVEKFEPGVHQFFPMPVKSGKKEIGLLSYFVVCNRIDGLDHNACVPPIKPGDRLYSPTYSPTDKRIFSNMKISGAHVWCEKHARGTWISDALHDAIFAEGLIGIKDSIRYEQVG